MPDQPEEAENATQDLQSGTDAAQSAASNAPRAVQYTGKAVQFAGKGVELAGQGLRALAPIPVVGWIAGGIGIGLMGAGKGMQAAGKGMEKGGQAAGKTKSALGPAGQLGPLKGLASPGGLAKFVPGPVGLAMRIKDLLSKLPVIGGLVNKLGDLNKKILMGIGAGIGYLLYLLAQLIGKLIALVGYAAAGAAIGFMVGGPVGALVGAAVGAFLGPKIVSIATNAFGAAKSVTSSAASIPGSVTGGITSGISSAVGGLTSAVSGAFSAVTGAVGGFIGGIGGTIGGIGGALGGILNAAVGAVTTTASASVLVTVGTVAVTGTFLVTMDEPGTHFTFDADNPSAASSQNQYFKVTKTASVATLPNSPPNNEVTFTITLTTTRNLSAVTVADLTSVQGVTNFNINNDKDGKEISPIPCPKIIPAGGNCTYSFTITVDSRFNDSVINNLVSATAVPEGQSIQSSTALATVKVGQPASICGIFQFQGPWSPTETQNVNLACQALDRSAKATSLLRNAGTVTLVRVTDGSQGSCGRVLGGKTIYVACDLSGTTNAQYVIIHELGHVIANANITVYQSFLSSGAYNNDRQLIPTYPFPPDGYAGMSNTGESFAEMVADYVISKYHNYPARTWVSPVGVKYPGNRWVNPIAEFTTFQNDWPAHYNFAKTEIFGGVEY